MEKSPRIDQKDWSGSCDRCHEPSRVHTMSMFNTDLLCMSCWKEEKEHPDYEEACIVEEAHVRKGECSFPGVGWPGRDGRLR